MFEALRTTASIIFAVIGAWMAIIYPERLKLSFKPDAVAAPPNPAKAAVSNGRADWTKLFTPVVNSTAILSIILFLGVVVPIVKRLELPIPVECLRGTSYGLLVALTLWQLWTVVLTLVPADKVKSAMDREAADRGAVNAFKAVGQKKPKGPESGNR